jgi:hypothetical protein
MNSYEGIDWVFEYNDDICNYELPDTTSCDCELSGMDQIYIESIINAEYDEDFEDDLIYLRNPD